MTRKIFIGILIILLANTLAVFLLVVAAHAKPASATFDVNDTSDLIDDNLTDGKCHTTVGTCTLRAAIIQANALGGVNTINLPAGVYTLTFGELAIQSDLILNGVSTDTTIVDGNQLGRVFGISGVVQVFISGVTVQNGSRMNPNDQGGGIKKREFGLRHKIS